MVGETGAAVKHACAAQNRLPGGGPSGYNSHFPLRPSTPGSYPT